MNRTPEEIVADVDDLVRAVWNDWENPEKLSEHVMKLAVLYTPIGNLLAEARDQENETKRLYDLQVARAIMRHREDKKPLGDAERLAIIEADDAFVEHLAQKNRVNMLKLKREDVEKLIDAARSRLSLIKGDMQRQ